MKYILELKDEPIKGMLSDEGNYYRCKQIPYWSIADSMRNKLTPYTEPDRKAIEDEVWEFAWKIYSMDIGEYAEIFDDKGCPSNYQDAKVKYEAWLKQKDEIHVGDEVTYTLCGDTVTFIVLGKKKNKYYGFNPNASDYDDVGEYCDADMLKKTGRHFPEVAELLQKMRGEE